jgi:5-formyltetrahydrofolate cyclo-ligase
LNTGFEGVLKSVVRSDVLQKIRLLSRAERQRQSLCIQEKLGQVLTGQKGIWGTYSNLSDEPEINWSEVSPQIEWAYPRLQSDQQMDFVIEADSFEKSTLGFLEPLHGQVVSLDKIKGFVIPAVAYGESGARLGRGQGYYDRTLQNHTGWKIGVCFNVSLCQELPSEEHDIRCDLVVTADQVYRTGRKFEGVHKWN